MLKRLVLTALGIIASGTILVQSVTLPAAEASGDCTATATSLSDPTTAGIWQYIMNTRTGVGESPLTWSPQLAQAGAWMAKDMATRRDIYTATDSLGRDTRTRDTYCGYRSDAQVSEARVQSFLSDPYGVYSTWQYACCGEFNGILYAPAYFPPGWSVAALGHYHCTTCPYPDYWVLEAGTLPESGGIAPPTNTPTPTATPVPPTPTRTPVPPTATAVPPTATQVPPTPTPDPYVHERACVRVNGDENEWTERCTD